MQKYRLTIQDVAAGTSFFQCVFLAMARDNVTMATGKQPTLYLWIRVSSPIQTRLLGLQGTCSETAITYV